MSIGLDPGYDVGLMSSGADVDIYTALVKDNGINFATPGTADKLIVRVI